MCMCMIYKCMMYDVYLISTVHVYVRGASFEGGKNPIIETSQEKKKKTPPLHLTEAILEGPW